MKINHLNTQSLLPAFLLLIAAGCTSSLAFSQQHETKVITKQVNISEEENIHMSKTVQIEEVDHVKVVTVTTLDNGEKITQIFKGEEAVKYLEEHEENMHDDMHSVHMEDIEDMHFTIDVENMKKGDAKKIIIVSDQGNQATGSEHHETIIWTTDNDNENHMDIEDLNIDVSDGDDGQPLKIQMSYTDENGKKVEKMMVIDEEEITKTMEDVQDILRDMDIDINFDMDTDDDHDETVVVSKKIMINGEEYSSHTSESSHLFNSFSISTNTSKGNVQLEFETVQEGKVHIAMTGMEGNSIFKDSYDGKGAYSERIKLNDYQGVVILTVTQGTEVEVRKLIID